MAQLFTTGPAHFFVQFPRSVRRVAANPGSQNSKTVDVVTPGKIAYIGTAEAKPKIQIRKGNQPIFNDVGGQIVPMDKLYTGQDAFIFADLSRFNNNVVEALIESPSLLGFPGFDPVGNTGTLILTEEQALVIWVLFPYGPGLTASKPAYRTMRAGYRFPACVWEGPEDQQIGVDIQKRPVIFHALRQYDPDTKTFILYDQVGLSGLESFID